MSGTAGKVALVSNQVTLTGSCPTAGVVDLVGYGSATNFFEGAAPTATLSNTTAALRRGGGCVETDDNGADFAVAAPGSAQHGLRPQRLRRRRQGPARPTRASSRAGASTLLTVAVTGAATPPSTGLTVTADLSSIGGSATQQFFDDGTNGDATAGDNTFSYQATVAAATRPARRPCRSRSSTREGRTGSTTIAVAVSDSCGDPKHADPRDPGRRRDQPDGRSRCTIEGVVVRLLPGARRVRRLLRPGARPPTRIPRPRRASSSSARCAPVSPGDVVRVRGRVTEFASGTSSLTELASVARSSTAATRQRPGRDRRHAAGRVDGRLRALRGHARPLHRRR